MTDMDVGVMNKSCLIVILSSIFISGCFNDGGSASNSGDEGTRLACDLSAATVSFQDESNEAGVLSGTIFVRSQVLSCNTDTFVVEWLSENGPMSVGQFTVTSSSISQDELVLNLPENTSVPVSATRLKITPKKKEQSAQPIDFRFGDVLGTAEVVGPGGNRFNYWYYGDDRPPLVMQQERRGLVDYCRFDNGRVLVHDANYETYESEGKNVADDILYPAYEFDCTDSKENLHRTVYEFNDEAEEVVQTYSVINDAFYYGNVSFDMFEKYLETRPLEKLRIRMHYGPEFTFNFIAHWDGAYVNLNDVLYQAYGAASLDVVAHEAAHGILQNHTALKHLTEVEEYTDDGRTLHEAYADIASVMAHYELYDELNWINGDENFSSRRRTLDRIETESGAILSYLDYSDAGVNFYKRMGMLTYPFYLLTEKWGIVKTFELYTDAAKSCWEPNSNLLQAATCIKVRSDINALNTQDVIDAFRTVKIKLADEDTFSHFKVDVKKRRTQFTDNSQTDGTIVAYRWNFGDGNTSYETSPYHEYEENGEYKVTLTVEDNTGLTDKFTRTMEVSDQYCDIRGDGSDWEFTSVEINGETLPFTAEQTDYTDTIIEVDSVLDIPIKIDGTVLNPEQEDTTWYIWVDLNDDADFGGVDYNDGSKSELRYRKSQVSVEYGLDATFTIADQYRGKTLYMRVSSDAGGFPCYSQKGSTFDVRIKVRD